MDESTGHLSPDDVELFDAARDLLMAVHDPVIHQVAAAMRSKSGHVYVGLHLGSRRVNVCAESSAIANAEMAQDFGIDTIVAVCKDETGRVVVTNPCGVCRELMTTYGPDAHVLIDYRGQVRSVAAAELMPNPWMFPHENEWSVEDPQPRSES